MAEAEARRILVLANQTLAGADVLDAVRERAAGGLAEILVVAPALPGSRVSHWLSSDTTKAREEAEERLRASVGAFDEAGFAVNGQLGDGDPVQALDDAVRVFRPHEIVIGTLPPERSRWLERDAVTKARARHDVPVTHLVVDVEAGLTRTDAPAHGGSGPAAMVRVFHGASHGEALEIRQSGFRDGDTDGGKGVLVVDDPTSDEWGDDTVMLGVDVPQTDLADAGAAGEGRYVLPAGLLNRHGPPITVDDWSE